MVKPMPRTQRFPELSSVRGGWYTWVEFVVVFTYTNTEQSNEAEFPIFPFSNAVQWNRPSLQLPDNLCCYCCFSQNHSIMVPPL